MSGGAKLLSAWIFLVNCTGVFYPFAPEIKGQEAASGNWALNRPGVAEPGKPADSHPDFTLEKSRPDWRSSSQPLQPEATAQDEPQTDGSDSFVGDLAKNAEALGVPKVSGSLVQTVLLLGALGLAPAILLMTTCYVRFIVVFGLLRQALGTSQLPPTQILMALSMFLTIVVMSPVWLKIKHEALDPYLQTTPEISWEEAWQRGSQPLKDFMVRQIEVSGNREAVDLFYKHGPAAASSLPPTDLKSAPLNVVLPAFILSELKVAFLLGFQIFLPFLIIDLVVSAVTVSMGLAMLSPAMVSLPLKLILFVMVDGWNLVVGMLLQSFG